MNFSISSSIETNEKVHRYLNSFKTYIKQLKILYLKNGIRPKRNLKLLNNICTIHIICGRRCWSSPSTLLYYRHQYRYQPYLPLRYTILTLFPKIFLFKKISIFSILIHTYYYLNVDQRKLSIYKTYPINFFTFFTKSDIYNTYLRY
jgi:hypothetical protein